MRRVVRRGLLAFKLFAARFMWPYAESPRGRIAGGKRSHDVVVNLGLAHLLATDTRFFLLVAFYFFCHALDRITVLNIPVLRDDLNGG